MKQPIAAVLAALIMITCPAFASNGTASLPTKKANVKKTGSEAVAAISSLYKKLSLKNFGLTQQAFVYAMKGYTKLMSRGVLRNQQYLTIIDFSQSSRKKRFYIIDVKKQKLVLNTYVAHGKNSGADKANRFSNILGSEQSSLGFYLTKYTYFGKHGLALKLMGLERGFNDRAENRAIVVHGSNYVNKQRANTDRMGRSQGCPALPAHLSSTAIKYMKGGSAMFVYHPTKNYLDRSAYLN